MKTIVIADEDTVIGFSLAGVQGVVVSTTEETRKAFDQATQMNDVGILLLTERVAQMIREKVDNWIKKYGVRYFNELTNLAILMEETGELARIISRKYGEQSFKKSDEEVTLEEELADILFVLICIANQTGVDLTGALEKSLVKKTKRDEKRHLENRKLKLPRK